jgi:hypothetical protein
VAYDDHRNLLVGLDKDGSGVTMYDPELVPVDHSEFPNSWPVSPCTGDLKLEYDPATPALWVICERLAQLLKITFGPGRTVETREVELQGAEQPTDVAIDDVGHLLVSDGGSLAEYDGNGRLVDRSPFAALPGGTAVEVSRSFSNFDPRTMSDLRFRNVLPEDSGVARP